jgi:hypothetical protein
VVTSEIPLFRTDAIHRRRGEHWEVLGGKARGETYLSDPAAGALLGMHAKTFAKLATANRDVFKRHPREGQKPRFLTRKQDVTDYREGRASDPSTNVTQTAQSSLGGMSVQTMLDELEAEVRRLTDERDVYKRQIEKLDRLVTRLLNRQREDAKARLEDAEIVNDLQEISAERFGS